MVSLSSADHVIFACIFSSAVLFGTEADMKREMERKELERKKSPKIDFVPGGTQPGMAAAALKIGTQVPGTDFS